MSLLLSPLTWLFVGLLVAGLGQHKRVRALRLPGIVLLALGWLGMTPAGANWLVGRIEREAVAPATACAQVEWLVLLAGGLDRAAVNSSDHGALGADSLRRVFALLANPPPEAWRRVVSGGGPHALAEATLIDDLLRRLQPAAAGTLLIETDSRTTWESAQAMATLLPPPRRIALASSALHLPRARWAFELAGFEVCLWPLDRQFIAARGFSAWLPQSSALRKSEAALHEVLGALYYRWLARRGAASSA